MTSDLGSFVGGHTPSLSDASNWVDGDILWVTSKDMKQTFVAFLRKTNKSNNTIASYSFAARQFTNQFGEVQ